MKRSLVAGAASGFSLVEVVLALGVTTFCLVALFGLLSVGLSSNRSTIEQAGAANVLSAAVADLYATPRSYGVAVMSPLFQIKIPATPTSAVAATVVYFVGNGQWSPTLQSQSVYALTVTPIVATPATTTRGASFFDLKVTWPAQAKANATGLAETFVALNRN